MEDGAGRPCGTSSRPSRAGKDGSTAAVACDHYHRYGEDVALMARPRRRRLPLLGLLAAGPADGPGRPTRRPRLLRPARRRAAGGGRQPGRRRSSTGTCRRRSRTAAAGWTARPPTRFAEYAALVVATGSATASSSGSPVNEPAVHTLLGHALGTHAPGRQLLFDALPAAHHQLLGHGLAVQALRAAGATDIGIANSTADLAGLPRPGRPGGRGALRRPAEPPVRRAAAARRVPGGPRRS